MAAREVLEYDDVDAVTLVDLDPAVIELAQSDERISALNEDSLSDPRVTTIAADAFAWLRRRSGGSTPTTRSSSTSPIRTMRRRRSSTPSSSTGSSLVRWRRRGGTVIQAGSPYFAPEAYWGVAESVRRAGLAVTPYHVDVPSFGDWGFLLAGAHPQNTLPARKSTPMVRHWVSPRTPGRPHLRHSPGHRRRSGLPSGSGPRIRRGAAGLDPAAPVRIDQHRRAWVAY